jgi:zinc/manganese transport system substrate-binding protein
MTGFFGKQLFRLLLAIFLLLPPLPALAAEPALRVCATVPELGSLAAEIGGERVRVTVFAKETEDPHYLDARPSFIKALSEADLFVLVGLELEAGWAPLLVKSSRNRGVQEGAPGYLDASRTIFPLEIQTGVVDRRLGDVHPEGNPHYLADPLNSLKVAALLRDRLTELRTADRDYFQQRYADFRRRLGEAMVGEALAGKYDFEQLVILHEHRKLDEFLTSQGDAARLGGWLGRLAPHRGKKIITYHQSWPYLAQRFDLTVIANLEPKPGISPGPGHLLQVIQSAQTDGAAVILMEPWLDKKAADFVAGKIGARVIQAATSSTRGEGPYSYLNAMDRTVRLLAEGLTPAP